MKFFLGNYLGGLGLAIWSRKTTRQKPEGLSKERDWRRLVFRINGGIIADKVLICHLVTGPG